MQRLYRMIFGVLLFLLLLSSAFSTVVFADPGEGDGGGGGPAIPLRMDWSFPANGERNVSVTPIIQCKFSHNVAQYTVIKRNATLFSMAKLDGTQVDINVYAADSQLEFDKRQYIYIEPVKPLEYNATYVVTAQEGIQAKNSMATEKAQSFQFTTCGRRTDFNGTSVSPMVGQEENKTAGERENPAAANTAGNGTENMQAAPGLSEEQDNPASESALASGGKEAGNTNAMEKSGFAPENLNSAVVTALAAGFLLILSVIVFGIRTKRQK